MAMSTAIKDAKTEFLTHVRDTPITCNINFTANKNIQTHTDLRVKEITINETYWRKLDYTAKKVTILRELIRCETHLPYLVGVSLMNRKITQAVAAYEYGAE